MKEIILLVLSFSLIGCKSNVGMFNNSTKEVNLSYELLPNSIYKMVCENKAVFNNAPTYTNSEYSITINSLEEIIIEVEKSEQIFTDEALKNDVEHMLAQVDLSTLDKVLNCYSSDGRTIKQDAENNDQADLKTLGAKMTWNSQNKFPRGIIRVGTEIQVKDTNKRGSINTVTTYRLNKIEDNIAYLSFEVNTIYDRGDEKMMSMKGVTAAEGELEYDIQNKYYRLMTRKESLSMQPKIDSPDEEKAKSINEGFAMTNETTTKITLVGSNE